LKQSRKYDILIIGSGFGGAIMAMCLSRVGYRVCLVEKGSHPRFAIGESSTPVADMILRDLANEYNLPFLKKLSRYGEWQKYHPEVVCGLKRGFSYYPHQKGELFKSDQNHTNELLVAASVDNENSDTNWLRSDVDHFLVQQLRKMDIEYFDHTTIYEVDKIVDQWNIRAERKGEKLTFTADRIIDATGSSIFAETFLDVTSTSKGFKTNSFAVYSHFEGAAHWQYYLHQNDFHTSDYPYNPDYSALHHLIDEGWIWMLRFNNDLLSSGMVIDGSTNIDLHRLNADKIWMEVLKQYPSVQSLFKTALPADTPGGFLKSNRLQRRLNRTHGEGWVALNHTAGFVDPLHSTGIAHTLTGVEKLLKLFSISGSKTEVQKGLELIESNYFKELAFIDLLVSSCYKSRGHFQLFSAAVMLYFAASIQYEQGRLNGSTPNSFLCAADDDLFAMVELTHAEISSLREKGFPGLEVANLVERVRARIAPYNSVGLMDDSKRNMYEHTAVVL
jgi:FADH2 O2-dependent halogenase